jgi:hypothetical protein
MDKILTLVSKFAAVVTSSIDDWPFVTRAPLNEFPGCTVYTRSKQAIYDNIHTALWGRSYTYGS